MRELVLFILLIHVFYTLHSTLIVKSHSPPLPESSGSNTIRHDVTSCARTGKMAPKGCLSFVVVVLTTLIGFNTEFGDCNNARRVSECLIK